jgi:hypothetical protein
MARERDELDMIYNTVRRKKARKIALIRANFLCVECLRREQMDKERTFWDSKELQRQTMLSWSTIQNEFFMVSVFLNIDLGGSGCFQLRKQENFYLCGWRSRREDDREEIRQRVSV